MHTKIDMKTTYAAVYQVSCTVCQASTYTSYKYEPPVYPEEIDYEDILTKIVNIVSPEETNPLDPKVLKALPELIKNINYWSEY